MARECPQCRAETVSVMRLMLWPLTTCSACGARVRLSGLFLAMFALAVLAIVAFAIVFATAEGDGAPVPAYIFLECIAVIVLVALYGGLEAAGGEGRA